MASRKVVKKTIKKAASKRVTRSPFAKSSKGLFETYKSLKWIVAVLFLLGIASLVVHHFIDEPFGSTKESSLRENVRSVLHLDSNKGINDTAIVTLTPSQTGNSTITPYVTVAPIKR